MTEDLPAPRQGPLPPAKNASGGTHTQPIAEPPSPRPTPPPFRPLTITPVASAPRSRWPIGLLLGLVIAVLLAAVVYLLIDGADDGDDDVVATGPTSTGVLVDGGPGAEVPTTVSQSTPETTSAQPAVTPAPTQAVPVTTAPAPVVAEFAPRFGTVTRTCGASGNGDCYLTVRQSPDSKGPSVTRYIDGNQIQVECQTWGERVRSSILGRPTDVWARLTGGNFVSMAFLDVDGWSLYELTVAC